MTFEITQQDIESSNYISNQDCAVAKAVRRRLPDAHIAVGQRNVYVNGVCYYFDSMEFGLDPRSTYDPERFRTLDGFYIKPTTLELKGLD